MKFLANVDPIDFFRATDGLDVEETLFVIVSKTFTTAETMLNARSCRNLILDYYKAKEGSDEEKNTILSKHLCAVSTNLKATAEFGIKDENVFGFWEWVGGRFSASSAVGLLPLSLFYSYDLMEQFLKGMNHIDNNFRDEKDVTKNIPLFLGLIGFYNAHITGNSARTILPYC